MFGPILRCKLSSKMVLMMQMTFINFAKIISTSASSLYVSKYSICFTKLKFLAANLKGQTLEIVPSLAISGKPAAARPHKSLHTNHSHTSTHCTVPTQHLHNEMKWLQCRAVLIMLYLKRFYSSYRNNHVHPGFDLLEGTVVE